MTLCSAAARAVFERYEARLAEEDRLMRALPMAIGMGRRDEWLLPVGPEVGRFLHALILAKKPRRVLELGTSYGYSTLFLADAAQAVGATLITIELADYKQAYAREMIAQAGLSEAVEFRLGDAVAAIEADPGLFDIVLLDLWKELYIPCLEAVLPKLAGEGIIAADNMIDPPVSRPEARAYRAAVAARPELASTLLPIGSGIELSTYWPGDSTKL